ncbi:hypothetical protein [Caldisericum sp.]
MKRTIMYVLSALMLLSMVGLGSSCTYSVVEELINKMEEDQL